MDNILHLKYKIFHFINILFYLVFYLLGWLSGTGVKHVINWFGN